MTAGYEFRGSQSIICGGSRGIGLETARAIVRRGGHVCIVARDTEVLEAAARQLMASRVDDSQRIQTIACDTSDETRLRPLLDEQVRRNGVPDYLINNVGFAYPQYVHLLGVEDFRRNMDVNYYGQLVPLLMR